MIYIKEDGEHPVTSEDEAEWQQNERDKKMRAELSIKEREKEVSSEKQIFPTFTVKLFTF